MNIRSTIPGYALVILLGACGDPEYRPMDEAMPVEESVFSDEMQMLEDARGVEDDLERMAREREEQMRRQGG